MNLDGILLTLENRIPFILGSENYSTYAVLLPLVIKNDEIHLVFEVRALTLRRQPGEVCFPGGKKDECDKDYLETAVRETCEELGLRRDVITRVFPLDFIVSPYGSIIYPYVGIINNLDELNINKKEVDHVFTAPLSFFKDTKPDIHYIQARLEPEPGFPYERIVGGENYNWQTRKVKEYFYYYEDQVIWGLTAHIIKHFLDLIEQS